MVERERRERERENDWTRHEYDEKERAEVGLRR